MKEALKYGMILCVITSICVGLLGAVNEVTRPIIEKNEIKAEETAMIQLMTDAKTFTAVEDLKEPSIEKLFVAQQDNQIVGYVVRLAPQGYGGAIGLMVGITPEGVVKGIQILSHSETPGFGANAEKPVFKSQFLEKKPPLTVTKNAPGADEIQAITGATITSSAITEGVNTACAYVLAHQAEWGYEG